MKCNPSMIFSIFILSKPLGHPQYCELIYNKYIEPKFFIINVTESPLIPFPELELKSNFSTNSGS